MRNVLVIVFFFPAVALAAATGYRLDRSPHELTDLVSLQSGARTYVNYCLGCHGIQFMRYKGLTEIGLSEAQIADAGIGRKFQKPTVFENHTVFENLELAMKTDKRVWASVRARLGAEQLDRISETLELIKLRDEADRLAGLLSHGQKQWLEIGMLLMQEPRLLLLDEPVAGMTDEETERTAELFKSLAGERSVVVVEHDMEFIGSIASVVTVLHEGAVLAEGTMEAVKNDERVIEVYLGR